jgi:tetratricopeptide (TPR) repeat protein
VDVNRRWWISAALLCAGAITAAGQVYYLPRPEAKIEFDRGKAALKIGNTTAAIDFFRKAVGYDPYWMEACSALAKSAKDTLQRMAPEYRAGFTVLQSMRTFYLARAAAEPDNAICQWALGEFDDSPTRESAERYYRAAIAINPKFVEAYQSLAATLAYRGDLDGERECLNIVCQLSPGDMDASANYARRVMESNPVLGRKLTQELLVRWHIAAGADLLARLAAFDSSLESRIVTLEQLKAWYPVTDSDITEWHMKFLFDAYNRTDPLKALALAQEMELIMSPRSEAGRDWRALVAYQQSMVLARSLMDRKSYAEAATVLKKMEPLPVIAPDPQVALCAQALDLSGKTDQAYQMVVRALAEQPSDGLLPILADLGRKRNRSAAQVDADLWAAIVRGAPKFSDFELTSYGDSKKVKLSDFRGRVVLLDFWNSASATAREDLPHLKKMLDKYETKGLTILTINTAAMEPIGPVLMNRYRFVALRAPDVVWARREFSISTNPSYFLLNRQGRLLYRPQFGSFDAQRAFELEVETLLAHEGK